MARKMRTWPRRVVHGVLRLLVVLYVIGWWFDPIPPESSNPRADLGLFSTNPRRAFSSFTKDWRGVPEHTFRSGDTFGGTLSLLGVSAKEASHILDAAQKVYDLRRVVPGQKIKVFLSTTTQSVVGLLYEIDPLRSLRWVRSERGFKISEDRAATWQDIVGKEGVITDTLFASAARAEVPKEVILNLTDIFAWDIDFGTEIQMGDRFRVAYEVTRKAGEVVVTGRILAAEIVNSGRSYRAYYFNPLVSGGKRPGLGDYYDETGRPLEKAFLKSPLRYRHITSGFTPRRFHPVLKVGRPHLGIDFAAPHGTPVMAASDGIVRQVGWQGGYGNTVVLEHANGLSTLYGHLSSYEARIRENIRVTQGEVIGRVGSTGLSTGPHLHYTLTKHGVPIDPGRVESVERAPLSGALLSALMGQIDKMSCYLDAQGVGLKI